MTGGELLFAIVVLNLAATLVLLPRRDDASRLPRAQSARALMRSGALRRMQ